MKFVKSFANLEGSIWAYLYEDGSLSIELPSTKNIELSPAGVKELCDVLEAKIAVSSPPEQKGCICFVNQHGVILKTNPECTAHPSDGLTQRAADLADTCPICATWWRGKDSCPECGHIRQAAKA